MDVRPLGIGHSLIRLAHREVMQQCKSEVREFLEPYQLGQSQAGAAKLVLVVRSVLDLHPNWVCVVTDIKNCYNEQNRRAVLDLLLTTPSLSHLVTFAAAVLAPRRTLEARGKVWGSTGTGHVQGDPTSSGFQSIGMQPSLERLSADCAPGVARAGADDVFALGPRHVVLPAIQCFASDIKERCGLSLQWGKSFVYCREGELPEYAAPGLTMAEEQVGDHFL